MAFDHELKMARALKHLNDLNEYVILWLKGDHHSVRYEYDADARWTGNVPPGLLDPPGSAVYYLVDRFSYPDRGRALLRDASFGQGMLTALASAEKPPTDPLGLLIGDVLHNMRSALDTLAYTLAVAHTKPLKRRLRIARNSPSSGMETGKAHPGVGQSLFHQTKRKTSLPAPGWCPQNPWV